MRLRLLGLSFIFVLTITAVAQSPSPTAADPTVEKLQPGIYLWNGNAWTPMKTINMSGPRGTDLMPQMVWTLRNASAPVHLENGKPLFCVKFYELPLPSDSPYAPSGRDIVIARFDEKKDHRELWTTSAFHEFKTFKAGLVKDRKPDIYVSLLGASTYIVTPKKALRPGEYYLSTSSAGTSGSDFGFHPPKH